MPVIDHSCSYHCQHAECIHAQRDELRDKYFKQLGLVKQDYAQGWNDLKAQAFSLEPRGKEREKELLISALSAIQMLTFQYRKEHGLDGAWDTPLVKGEETCQAINNYLKCL